MAELFEVAELVKVAVEDEKSGVAFYTKLAQKPGKFRDVFSRLAEEEQYHQKRFEAMLAGLGNYKPREQYPGEYMEYLNTLTSSRAFPDAKTAAIQAQRCDGDAAALDLAIRFERDTIILMNEMRSLVPAKDITIVDELAAEEHEHLVILIKAQNALAPAQ